MNSNNVRRLLWARGLRAFGDGFVSLLLPVYLLNLGLTPFQVGLIATTTLLGSGVLTLLIGIHASRYDHRPLLLAASALMAFTGLGIASLDSFWPLMLVALVGTLNPSGGDVSVFMPVEHAMLASDVEGPRRTAIFARYSLTGTLFAAFGSLAAALPALAAPAAGITTQTAIKAMFFLYAVLALVMATLYRGLPLRAAVEVTQPKSALGP